MEYSRGTAGSGAHSHEPVGKLALPCESLAQKYKATCYAAAGSYDQYAPGSRSFDRAYAMCETVPATYREDCFNGVSERALVAYAQNSVRLDAMCESLTSSAVISACKDSTSKLLSANVLTDSFGL